MNSKTTTNGTTLAPAKVASLNTEVFAITDLKVAPYQRHKIKGHIAAMAEDFDLDQFGIPVVARRKTGDVFVVNGLQRITAAQETGYTHVEAHVFESRGVQHEAKMFLIANRSPRKVSGNLYWEAACYAREPYALWGEGLLNEVGMTGRPSKTDKLDLMTSTGLFEETYVRLGRNVGPEQTTECVRFALAVLSGTYSGDMAASAYMFKALVTGFAYAKALCPDTDAAAVIAVLRDHEVDVDRLADEAGREGHGAAVNRYQHNLRVFINGLVTEDIEGVVFE